MTQPKGHANRGSQQHDDAQPIFALPEEQAPGSSATALERDADEITDQLDGISGGLGQLNANDKETLAIIPS